MIVVYVALLFLAIWAIDFAFVTTCPCCGQRSARSDVYRRRLNTNYCKSLDEQNYMTSCGGCYADAYEYYADLWSSHYQGCM